MASAPAPRRPSPAPRPSARAHCPTPSFETKAFARAVARGTRTRTGEPGPNYWQQFARYRIDAEFVPATSQINGRETVRYFNHSPDTLRTVWIFLNQNLFASTSPRGQSTPVTGGTEILRVAVAGQALSKRDTGVAYSVDGTLMRVGLPRALAPHDSVDFDIAWAFQLPPDGAPREGTTGDVFMVAYWYPQFAVYDDVTGWQIDPYLGSGRVLHGLRRLRRESEPAAGLARRRHGRADEPRTTCCRSRRATDSPSRGAARASCASCASRTAAPARRKATKTGFDGVLTWRFRARNVRDFDWGASSKFLWDATVAVVGDRDRDGRPDTTAINTFYRPEARAWSWDKSAEYERSAVEFLSNYLWPYPWPQMTALEGPVSCTGMEYPMLTCIGGPRDTLSLYSVQIHETGHMWFPMQVGSDERRFAWQDEGLTRFNQAQGMQAYFKGYDRETHLARRVPRAREDRQRSAADAPRRPIPVRHARVQHRDVRQDGDEPGRASRPARRRGVSLDATARTGCAGCTSIRRNMTSSIPSTRSPGRDLSWFWRTWWYETWTLDQAIASVDAGRRQAAS